MFEKSQNIRERKKIRAFLKLNDGEPIEGYFFCMNNERVNDLLNDDRLFFPFQTIEGELLVVAKSSVAMAMPKDNAIEAKVSTDPYEVLGVSPDATLEDVKQAYRQRMQEYHPDRFAQAELPEELTTLANDMASRITNAYQKLSEQLTRKEAS